MTLKISPATNYGISSICLGFAVYLIFFSFDLCRYLSQCHHRHTVMKLSANTSEETEYLFSCEIRPCKLHRTWH